MTNIAIFASGGGTNAENIARTFAGGNRVRVAVAITNNRDAGVIKRMEAFHIPVLYFPNAVWSKEPQKIVEALKPYSIDLVALAGFMRRVAPEILEAYPGRVINIHPSLLPRHGGKGMYGHHVHEAVIADGDKESGVTVHYVTDEIDGGSIILQKSFPLAEGETAETLEAKIHPVEYEIFCDQHGIKYTESRDFGPEIINNTDILYMTRVQRERFTDLDEYERVKNIYTLRNAMLADSRPNLRILHPLPRVGEINPDVDDNPKAYYFNQAQNGLYARQAIICKVLGIDLTQLKNSAK